MASKLAIGFLGTGKMATSLARGFILAGLVKPGQVIGSDPLAPAREAFAKETGARTAASNEEVAKASTVLVLAVKPDHVSEVLAELRGNLSKDHLVISIAGWNHLGQTRGWARGRSARDSGDA